MGRREIGELAAAAGRDPDSLIMSTRVEIEVHGGPSSAMAATRTRISGDDVGQMIASIEAYRSVGVEHIVLALNSGDVPRITAAMERIARDVIPRFR